MAMERMRSNAMSEDLRALSRRLRPALIAFFTRRLRDPALAEDLTQDLFCRLAANPARDSANPEAYVFQIAANLVRDHYRRETVRGRYRRIAELADDREIDRIDAERTLSGRENVGRVAAVLNTLPERTRNIFILYRLEGMQRKPIADAFGISVSAVEKHIASAMRLLLEELGMPQ
jgi:RNA polymerase sigma factor (sigma-70 family)